MAVDENREGIRGMANPGRYGIERVAYWLMRLTGLGLLAYFVAHIYETSNILQGEGRLGRVSGADAEHRGACRPGRGDRNVRLSHGERNQGHAGPRRVGVGRPGRPDYPYVPQSQNARHKIMIYSAIVLAAVAMLYGLTVMFGE